MVSSHLMATSHFMVMKNMSKDESMSKDPIQETFSFIWDCQHSQRQVSPGTKKQPTQRNSCTLLRKRNVPGCGCPIWRDEFIGFPWFQAFSPDPLFWNAFRKPTDVLMNFLARWNQFMSMQPGRFARILMELFCLINSQHGYQLSKLTRFTVWRSWLSSIGPHKERRHLFEGAECSSNFDFSGAILTCYVFESCRFPLPHVGQWPKQRMPTRTLLFLPQKLTDEHTICSLYTCLEIRVHHSPFLSKVNLNLITHKLLTQMPPLLPSPKPKLTTGPWKIVFLRRSSFPFCVPF